MNQSIGRFKAIGITLLILCLCNIICGITVLCMPVPVMLKMKTCAMLLAFVFALYYMLKGYSKKAAAAYKAYMAALFVVYQLAAVTVNVPNEVRAAVASFVACLNAGLYLVLAAVENLGEKLSKGMVITAAAISVALLFGNMFVFPGVFHGNEIANTAILMNCGALVTLNLIAVAMVYAKYKDKTQRGTK